MPGPLKVLIAEDNPDDAEIEMLELERCGFDVTHQRVQAAVPMRAALADEDWDLVVSDYSMPGFTAIDALDVLKASGKDIPFIIVSGTIGEDAAVRAMRAGAHDYFVKGRLARLGPVVERELREAVDRRDRRAAEKAAVEALRDKEREARAQAALLRSVIDSLADPLVAVDRDGHFILWNAVAEGSLGHPLADIPLEDWPERFGLYEADSDRLLRHERAPVWRALRGEIVTGFELVQRLDPHEGGVRLQVNARPLLDDKGNVRGAVAVYRDVTAERKAHAQLVVSDRMASVGMLAAGVAHEINNPLGAVMAYLTLLDRGLEMLEAPAEQVAALRADLAEACEGADRVRLIVKDLKIFSRSETETRAAVDVASVMESSLRMAWNEIRHRAQIVRAFEDAPPVLASESRLGQVFLNLLVNAAQALPLGKANENEIRMRVRVVGAHVIAEVEDTGPGIAPEHLARLFTPFFTTKPIGTGTGLGLSICHRIVTELNGEISVRSVVGSGTTFCVKLPATTYAQALEAAAELPVRPRRRGRIMVVDDERAIRQAVQRILSPEHEVIEIADASAAFDRIAAGDRFDVILCDLMMPNVSGMDFYEQVAHRAPEQAERIFFLTGGAFTPQAQAFLDRIPNKRLDKPIDVGALRRLLSSRVV